MQPSTPDDVGHGATLALRCTPCHGPTGISFADSPNLASQYATAVYKQLRDFKSGVRTNAIMNPVAQALSDSEMQQIAAYYSSRARPVASRAASDPPAIVKWGAPMRNVAPCGSCHGGADHSAASPWLSGEPAAYLRAQLNAFAAGARTNDINGQMRAMARGMTPAEIDMAAFYFAGSTGPVRHEPAKSAFHYHRSLSWRRLRPFGRRLRSPISGSAPEPQISARVQGCATCHGAAGEGSQDENFPRIAGKPAGYLFNQLQNFREGRRSYPPMNYLLGYLHDDYFKDMATFFAGQRIPFAPTRKSSSDLPLPPSSRPVSSSRAKERQRSRHSCPVWPVMDPD